MRQGLTGVLRAKGFYWTDDNSKRMGFVSIAGKIMRADYLADWEITQVDRGRKTMDEVSEKILERWLPKYGDRRQEIVFIGIDLDKETIASKLKACFSDSH
jgi:G3E family GTPase